MFKRAKIRPDIIFKEGEIPMNREITKFYEKIFEDAAFREKLELKMKEVKSESELKELIKEEIIPIAQKMGKSFTVDDLMNFEKESMRILHSY